MKMLPPHMVLLVLCLMGFFSGELEGFNVFSSRMQNMSFDMAVTSFDDQYDGCVDQMEEKVGELQRMEFVNSEYAELWQNATADWEEMKPEGLQREYAIAVTAYTQGSLFRQLNRDVQKAGESERYYLENFHFKSFHFLLTRALQILKANSSGKCYTTYRGINGTQFITEPSEKVRFGYFASSSLDKKVATRFGTGTLFTIRTCYGAYIKEFSKFKEEEEVLIPPYELFRVEDFQATSDGIRISLTSLGKYSKYNCVYIKGAGLSHLHADARMPFLFWGFLLMAGALGAPGFL